MRKFIVLLSGAILLGLAVATSAQEKPAPDAKFGNWLYKMPDGKVWKKTEANGTLVFAVDRPPGDFCTLTLFAGGKAEADFAQQFAAAVDADQKLKGTVKIEADGGPQASKSKENFDVLTRSLRSETATLHTLHIYVGGHSRDRFDLAAFQTTGEESWKRYGAQAGEFLNSVKLANSLDPVEVERLVGKPPGSAFPPTLPAAVAALPAAVASADAPGEVLWAGAWFKATVVKREGEKRYIHYEGYGNSFDEWVGPERWRAQGSVAPAVAGTSAVKEAPTAADLAAAAKAAESAAQTAREAAALPVARGDARLEGLYLQVQSSFFNGRLSLEYLHYYFFADGHIYQSLPPGGLAVQHPGAAEFAALLKVDPKLCGTYLVRGKNITFQLPGEKPSAKTFTYEKPGDPAVVMLDGLGAVKVGRFKDDQKLDATYEGGASAVSAPGAGPQTYVAASNTLDFHPDGTWGQQSIASISSTGDRAGASGGSSSASGGKYKLSGNTLTLTSVDGKQSSSHTIFPYPDKDEFPPARLFCDGTAYRRERPKP